MLATSNEESHIYSFIKEELSSFAHLHSYCAVSVRFCCAYTRTKYRHHGQWDKEQALFLFILAESRKLGVKSVTALMKVDSQSYILISHLSLSHAEKANGLSREDCHSIALQ